GLAREIPQPVIKLGDLEVQTVQVAEDLVLAGRRGTDLDDGLADVRESVVDRLDLARELGELEDCRVQGAVVVWHVRRPTGCRRARARARGPCRSGARPGCRLRARPRPGRHR